MLCPTGEEKGSKTHSCSAHSYSLRSDKQKKNAGWLARKCKSEGVHLSWREIDAPGGRRGWQITSQELGRQRGNRQLKRECGDSAKKQEIIPDREDPGGQGDKSVFLLKSTTAPGSNIHIPRWCVHHQRPDGYPHTGDLTVRSEAGLDLTLHWEFSDTPPSVWDYTHVKEQRCLWVWNECQMLLCYYGPSGGIAV